MIYILLSLTLIAGIVIRWLVAHLPIILHKSWREECIAYLQGTHPSVLNNAIESTNEKPKIKWWRYLPFSSVKLLALDCVLFASSLLVFYQVDGYLYWGSGLLFTWILITSSIIDFEHQILPDELTYILLWTGLLCSCWNLYTYSTGAILGALIAYLSLFTISLLFKLIRKKDGIGQGDLKLFAAIATWTGFTYLPFILFLASVFSLIYILLRKIISGKPFSAPASFGPFLALSGWLILLWGRNIASYILT